MSNVTAFPNWKKDATPAERFDELAGLAREFPERFERFVLCYKEVLPSKAWKYRVHDFNCNVEERIGMFEIAKQITHYEAFS